MQHRDENRIAVIGMAGRFPQAPDVDALWDMLLQGREGITRLTREELLEAGVRLEEVDDPSYVPMAGLIDQADAFDARLFGFSPKEAEYVDPQQRVFLETALSALEDAGCNPYTYRGAISVYAGAAISLYQMSVMMANYDVLRSSDSLRTLFATGVANDYLATRVAYKLRLRGPAVTVQTACSTSLVAVHMACQSLLSGESDVALAGGVSIQSSCFKSGYMYSEGGMTSPDGRCRPFDEGAGGTIFTDGSACVVLKRLADALADGDHVYAVIRGTAINNDGSEKLGFAAPGIPGQAAVVAEALAQGGVHPDEIDYVEAHGTGTALGDPIELTALSQAFRAAGSTGRACPIGSLKGNVGHLNHAAGVTGLIKVIQSLRHGRIPPSLHFKRLNPNVSAEDMPFFVPTEGLLWQRGERPRLAGVNSFGIGGTNAHVIVEEGPPASTSPSAVGWHALTLSAKTDAALQASAARLQAWLEQHPHAPLADVAHTLSVGRIAYQFGAVVVAQDAAQAAAQLRERSKATYAQGAAVCTTDRSVARRPVAFLFPGQGSQRRGMGASLRRTEPAYARAVEQALALAARFLPGVDLEATLYGDPADPGLLPLDRTDIAQPAIFLSSWAMCQLWLAHGVRPDYLLGHSIGELVAAAVAGVLTLEDAFEVVVERGRLMMAMPRGRMLAVPLPAEVLAPLMGDELCLAAVNAPAMCVVSGEAASIDALAARLKDRGVFGSTLRTSHAFHSWMMRDAVPGLVALLRTKTLRAPSIPIVSNLTGELLTDEQACNPAYWGEQLLGTVRFAQGIQTLRGERVGLLVEVGFGRTLSTLAQEGLEARPGIEVITSVGVEQAQREEQSQFVHALGRAWTSGAEVDWRARYSGEARRIVPLPGYAFEREPYWAMDKASRAMVLRGGMSRRSSGPADWTHTLSWRRQAPARAVGATPAAEPGSWLVFGDDTPFSTRLVADLRAGGATVREVRQGEEYQDDRDRNFVLDPQRPEHFQLLTKTLQALPQPPGHLVYLWSLGRQADGSAGLEPCYLTPMRLVQALGGASDADAALRLCLFTRDVQAATGAERIDPDGALLFGLSMVIPVEHGNLPCLQVDLDSAELGADPEALARRVAGILRSDAPAAILALRAGSVWVPVSDPVVLPTVAPDASPIRRRGVYLVTGGLGDLGLAIARHLAAEHEARLILVSRQQLPPEADWERLCHDSTTSARLAATLRSLLEIRRLGGDVCVGSANVADAGKLATIVEQAVQRFGPVHGVFHAAGLPGSGPIILKSQEQIDKVFDAKVGGMRAIERCFEGRELDFIVLFSTIASVIGGIAQSDYGPANAWLDALARRGPPPCTRRLVSFNWDAWGELGMAVTTVLPEPAASLWAEEIKQIGISTRQGMDILMRGLASGLPQLVVCKRLETGLAGHAEGVVRLSKPLPRASDAMGLEASPSSQRYPRPALSAEYVAPRNELETVLVRFWSDALHIDGIGIHDDFFELGGHSLLALQMIPKLREHFGTTISPRELFGQSVSRTIAELAPIIEAKLIEEITAELAEGEPAVALASTAGQ